MIQREMMLERFSSVQVIAHNLAIAASFPENKNGGQMAAVVERNVSFASVRRICRWDISGHRREGFAVLEREDIQQRPHRSTREHESDEEQNRAEDFVPTKMHEVEDNEEEFDDRQDNQRRDQKDPVEGESDRDDFHARDHREKHRDLHVSPELVIGTVLVRVRVAGYGGSGGRAHGRGKLS
jgi:hypothetical protein